MFVRPALLASALMVIGVSAQADIARPDVDLQSSLVKAQSLLRASLAAHGSLDEHTPPLTLHCSDAWNELGHLQRPKQLAPLQLDVTVTFDAAHDQLRTRTLHEGDPPAERRIDGARTPERFELGELLPSWILRDALAETASLRWLGTTPLAGAPVDVVAFSDAGGVPRALYLDVHTHLLRRVERLEADPMFGDDRQVTDYAEPLRADGFTLYRQLTHDRLWYRQEDVRCAVTPSPRPPMAPSPPPPAPKPPQANVARLGDGLYEIRLEHLDNRVLFYELRDYVVAMEAPQDSATGELILDAIARTTHGKPVRYLLLSHHHPDYVGGLRPFVARGAHIVTTPGNVDYVRLLAAAPHRLQPDRLERAPLPVVVDVVRDQRTFSDGRRSVTVYNLGARTGHTDEYQIYDFPTEHALFVGDLLRTGAGSEAQPAGARGLALWDAIAERKLAVERIYQSWPLHDARPFTTIETLRAQVERSRPASHR